MTPKQKRPLVAIDSMVLVWGVRRAGTEEQLRRARWLFDRLEEQKAQIVVPAVSLAEYLTHIAPADHEGVVAAMCGGFVIQPFDVRCVSLAARLFVEGRPAREMGVENARKLLRADTMVVASAKASGAIILYTNDAGCRGLAKRVGLPTEELPSIPDNLYDLVVPPDATATHPPPSSRPHDAPG